MIGRTQGYYPKLLDFKRMIENDFTGLEKTKAKSLEFWSSILDFSIINQDPYLEDINTIKTLYKQMLEIPVWNFIAKKYEKEELDEEHLLLTLQKNFPKVSKSAIELDIKALLKMHDDYNFENPFYEIIFNQKNNLAKRHLIETGFARIYNEEEKLSQNEISDYFDRVYKHCPSFKNTYLTQNRSTPTINKTLINIADHLINNISPEHISLEEEIMLELYLINKDSSSYNKTQLKNINKIKNIYSEIEFYISKLDTKFNLQKIYDKLSSPPYGLTNQIISLLLLNALLKCGDKISLYEKNNITLEITPRLYKRLLEKPQNFEVQKNIFDGEKRKYLEFLSEITLYEKISNVLHLAKALTIKTRELDKYTKCTSTLSKPTKNIRNIILRAQDPHSLIFTELAEFSLNEIKIAFEEMSNSYSNLMAEIESFLFNSFNINIADKKALEDIFKSIIKHLPNNELKIFANNILIDELPYDRWLERIATVINKKRVPKDWDDNDLKQFKKEITKISLIVKVFKNNSNQGMINLDRITNSIYKAIIALPEKEQSNLMKRFANT